MKILLVGAELEENLGLRYMVSSLEYDKHEAKIIPFNTERDIPQVIKQVITHNPQITGLSMVFTGRAREFCNLAIALRSEGYQGHIIAGGHFASLNCEQLLKDFPAFDSIGLGEGEELMCNLAHNLENISNIPGLCYRESDGSVRINPSNGNPENLDALPFPKRTVFHEYFGKPIASILSSRGCWRNCAFCSINAWYKRGGGKKFRIRSVENITKEMKELYFKHGVRIFNFQDDNFFLPDSNKALDRFKALRSMLQKEGVEKIAIAIKARPDSITYDSIRVLDDLGLFRVFLGVENASENGLRNLNRKNTFKQILNSLKILNDFDVHIAFNILMFEPDTVLDDILINLYFLEKHIENPYNFCRAEAYAGTGLETKLRLENRLIDDYFGFDYRLKDPKSEAFHKIANYAFFDRNFSDFGLHYFNMQVDFYYQLLRRFYPELLTQTLRGVVRSFIKQTNIDTYQCLCKIYDLINENDSNDQIMIQGYAREMRRIVDEKSNALYTQGEQIIRWLEKVYEHRKEKKATKTLSHAEGLSFIESKPTPYLGMDNLTELEFNKQKSVDLGVSEFFGMAATPIPYHIFMNRLSKQKEYDVTK